MDPIVEWLAGAVLTSNRSERAAGDRTIKKLQADTIKSKLTLRTMLYLDKLEGRITLELFDICTEKRFFSGFKSLGEQECRFKGR